MLKNHSGIFDQGHIEFISSLLWILLSLHLPSKRKACLCLNLLLYLGRTVPWSQPWCSLFSQFCFFLCISVKFGEGSFVNLHLSHHDSQKSLDFAVNWGWGRGWWAETVGVGEIQRRLNATPEQQNLPECQHLWGKWLWLRDSTRSEEPAGEGGVVQSSWSQHFTNCGEVLGMTVAACERGSSHRPSVQSKGSQNACEPRTSPVVEDTCVPR